MNFQNFFRKLARSPPPSEKYQIEPSSDEGIFNHDQKQKQRPETIFKKEKESKPNSECLTTKTISPNREQNMFLNQRCKTNILREFQKYIIYKKILGEGSFSRVYLGQAKKSKKLVAIKQVQKLEENQIACLMNSDCPNIIRLYDFWSFERYSYIALELCQGNLRDVLDKTAVEEKIIYFEQIVEGINYLNRKNIIHRDLKFQNILLKNNSVKISDFGFAKPIGSKLAVFSQKCGTPYTMAPEIFFHQGPNKPVYTHKCDIYSLGVILHEMIYNKHPFDYSTEKMRNNNRVILNKKFGVLDVLIDRCLEQQVARRCNWSQFMQIFTLFRMKKPQLNLNPLRQRNFNLPESKKQEIPHFQKPLNDNVEKYNKNIYETPIKNQPQKQKQNPFRKIDLPIRKNIKGKFQERKPIDDNLQIPKKNQNLAEKKLRQQVWKIQNEQYFENKPEKQKQLQNETISAVKLIFLVIAILSLVVLFQKQLK